VDKACVLALPERRGAKRNGPVLDIGVAALDAIGLFCFSCSWFKAFGVTLLLALFLLPRWA